MITGNYPFKSSKYEIFTLPVVALSMVEFPEFGSKPEGPGKSRGDGGSKSSLLSESS